MLLTDRPEFDKQIKVMMGGFPGYFLTEERLESYWRGLQKMQMSSLIRVVDHVLSEDGPEKIPGVSAMWTAYHALKTPRADARQVDTAPAQHFIFTHAQRCMLKFLMDNTVSNDALPAMIEAKNRIVEQYKSIATMDEVSGSEIRDALFKAWRASTTTKAA